MSDIDLVDQFEKVFENSILGKKETSEQLREIADQIQNTMARVKLREAAASQDLDRSFVRQDISVARSRINSDSDSS